MKFLAFYRSRNFLWTFFSKISLLLFLITLFMLFTTVLVFWTAFIVVFLFGTVFFPIGAVYPEAVVICLIQAWTALSAWLTGREGKLLPIFLDASMLKINALRQLHAFLSGSPSWILFFILLLFFLNVFEFL